MPDARPEDAGMCVPRVSPEIARPVFAPRMPRKPPAPPPMPGHGPGWIGGAGRMQSGKTAVCPAPEA